jgi:hypothetical protein
MSDVGAGTTGAFLDDEASSETDENTNTLTR